jgi:hypothetical protein
MDDLSLLAEKYNTDKLLNGYTETYDRLLKPIRNSCKRVLEIGVLGGASLATWKEYFPNVEIWGIDKNKDCLGDNSNYKLFCIDQGDELRMTEFAASAPKFDLIVDDGSHIQRDQQQCFRLLFPNVVVGGYYIIEDCVTEMNCRRGSYWGQNKSCSDVTLNQVEDWIKGTELLLFGDRYLTEHTDKIEIVWGSCLYAKYELMEPPCSRNWPGAVSITVRKK